MELPSQSGGATPMKLTGEGAFDYGTRQGTLTMDTSALGIPGFGGKIDVLLLGDLIYMKLPAGLLPGKPWLKLDLKTLGQTAGFNLGGLSQLGSSDPSSRLRFLAGIGDTAKKVGEEKVRGVSTTHYAGTVDLEKAKAKAPANVQTDIDALIKQLGKSTVPADVWVDGDDLIRRIRMTFEPAPGSAAAKTAGGGKSTVTQELFDFGVKVGAAPPPADQVSDFTELLKNAGR
jgi:hypothetical protein